ncbi:MAG UNVERIFIED_CONTAM: hypothetical protein LVT10_06165 [Anaerolineae bacterium]
MHYRGLVVLALLLVGNLFCMACPFTLPRTLAKRLSLRGGRFPKQLRNKWLSIIGLFTLFFAYEWLRLVVKPVAHRMGGRRLYGCFVCIGSVVQGIRFLQICLPIGDFNFVYSTLPTRIGVHRADVCGSCVGKECINGSYSPQPLILIDQIGQSVQHAPSGGAWVWHRTFRSPDQNQPRLHAMLWIVCGRAPTTTSGCSRAPRSQNLRMSRHGASVGMSPFWSSSSLSWA